MKTKIYLLFLFVPLKSFAQKERPIRIGLKLGSNFSRFTNNEQVPGSANSTNKKPFKNYTRLISVITGITGEYPLNKKISLGAELLYSTKGGTYRRKNDDAIQIQNGQFIDAYDFYKYKIDYLELPLIANYHLYKQNIRIYGGLAPGILIKSTGSLEHAKSTVDFGMDTGESEKDSKRDLMDATHKFNLSSLLGIQLSDYYSEDKTLLYLDLRISHTLLPVFKTNQEINTKMLIGTIGLGLKF